MRITYDAEVDALYIRFIETTVTTQHVDEGIAVDYASDGRVAGIEILDALAHFKEPDVLRRVVLEDVALAPPVSPTLAPIYAINRIPVEPRETARMPILKESRAEYVVTPATLPDMSGFSVPAAFAWLSQLDASKRTAFFQELLVALSTAGKSGRWEQVAGLIDVWQESAAGR